MRKIRKEAVQWAGKVMDGKDYGDATMARMWSWAVFYENFVLYGADETNKRMSIVPETQVVPLTLIKGPAK